VLAEACETVKVRPPIVNVPVRAAAPVLTATLNVTAPSPVPLDPDEIAIHGASLLAVHEQDPAAETLTVPVPPAAAAL
jgi:hypothetical protein